MSDAGLGDGQETVGNGESSVSSVNPREADPEEHAPSESGDAHHDPEQQWPVPPPRLIRDSELWVWLWVIGAVVLLAIIIVAVMTLPSKKSVGPVHRTSGAMVRTVAPPTSAEFRASGADGGDARPSGFTGTDAR
ncbi:MAG: hypothetical protein ACLQPH_11310 [Acidimicrobiales bacterium]